ncbi:igE-binding protein-like [Chionomys nivalis]|uniref:igE-binding protein-like n=1 Tax=Chionomys nivalis TaxID=269649 RepID=UPI002597A9B3|nr:igE-binding protein-like [Chionomys nivalis]
MGSSQSIVTVLETVLKQRDIKVANRTLKNFVKEIDRVAPWYVCSGSLTLASWNKLGKDLDKKLAEGELRQGTRAIWKLIKNCLEDEACRAVVAEGRNVLEEVQDSMSETERSERLGARKKKPVPIKENGPPGASNDKGVYASDPRGPLPVVRKKGSTSLYPLQELEALIADSSDDSKSSEEEDLDPEEEAELEEEEARYEEERYHPDDHLRSKREPRKRQPYAASPQVVPSAPPPYEMRRKSFSFLPEKVKRKLHLAYPVFEGAEGGRVHAPIEYNQLKELAESVRKYGVTANFTLAQLDRLAMAAMTPADWQTVAKASLVSMGQYLEWKALWHEAAQEQARANAMALTPEQQQWTFDLLTGQGRFAANQTDYHWGAYRQIADMAIRAWKALSKKGEVNNQLTKIIQGTQEPFSDFVARMTEAAGRIFGDPETAAPLTEQLIFENATQECRAAIAPRKNKGLQDWLRICRELGGPLTNVGLAAAILQSQKRPLKGPDKRVCFKCGKPGHFKKDCRASERERAPPTLCTRCGKGYHKAELCRSVRDIKGRVLPPMETFVNKNPKNGAVGPRSQGPQKYGNRFIKATDEAPPETEQEWTCAPPPTSY